MNDELYYKLSDNIEHLGVLKNRWDRIFLKDFNYPYVIWMSPGVVPFERIEQYSLYFNNRFSIFLFEVLTLSDTGAIELDSILEFVKKYKLKNINVYTVEYNIHHLQQQYKDLNLYCFDLSIRYAVVFPYMCPVFDQRKLQYKFHCGNWRYSVARHLIMSKIANMNGIYSWYYSCSFETLSKNNWFNFDKLDSCTAKTLIDGVNTLNNNDFFIDHKNKKKVVEDVNLWYLPRQIHKFTNSFTKSFPKAFCSIVTETRFEQPYGNFSEKTTITMAMLLPFILVAPPHTLKYLKLLGFKTFSNWWDESYDAEDDHQRRMIKIFNLIDFINNKSLNELEEMYMDMRDVLIYNQQHVLKLGFDTTILN